MDLQLALYQTRSYTIPLRVSYVSLVRPDIRHRARLVQQTAYVVRRKRAPFRFWLNCRFNEMHRTIRHSWIQELARARVTAKAKPHIYDALKFTGLCELNK